MNISLRGLITSAIVTFVILPDTCIRAQTEFSTQIKCDFTQGIPTDFTLYDNDGNTPAAGMQKMGFAVGTPWIAYAVDEENYNKVACSTSYYKPSGTSDDWMVLPLLKVEKNAKLQWRSKATDKKYRDGFAVYVSTAGKEISDFDKSKPLFSVAEEDTLWHEHTVNLSDYEGKNVYIAFVNNSINKSRLYVDDIFAGVPVQLGIKTDIKGVVNGAASIHVKGEVYTELLTPIKGFHITLKRADGTSTTLSFPDSIVSLSKSVAFDFPDNIEVKEGESTNFSLIATHDTLSGNVNRGIYSFKKNVVAEELTATWCAWCVRGIVYTALMKEKYPNNLIVIAVHDNDIMTVDNYLADIMLATKGQSIPDMLVDRKYEGDPLTAESMITKALADTLSGGFNMEATADVTGKTVNVTTHTAFADNNSSANYSLYYVVVENNIHHPENNAYCQKNAYAGGENGEMGGFENKPSVISSKDMYFNDVAERFSIVDLPTDIQGGKLYDTNYTVQLPDSNFNSKEAELVVMLVDKNTKHIINARQVELSDIVSGIDAVKSTAATRISADGDNIVVKSEEPIKSVLVYTVDGVLLKRLQPNGNNVTVNMGKLNGLFIVKVTTGNNTVCRKFLF
jgi:thiol-disulfide isomerase/thioredoxin